MKNRRRPSWSNIAAVLFALWLGMSCGSCTYVAPPPTIPGTPYSCVVLVTGPHSDSLTIGVYRPPCGEERDTVFYWRLPLPRSCAAQATIETPRGAAKVQSACPTLPPLPRG